MLQNDYNVCLCSYRAKLVKMINKNAPRDIGVSRDTNMKGPYQHDYLFVC